MHLNRTCFTKHRHYPPGSSAPDHGIIHQHHPLPFHYGLDCRKLHPYPLLPHGLRRIYECPAYIFVLYQPHLIRQPRSLAITHGRTETRIRHTYDHISISRRLLPEQTAALLSETVYIAAFYVAVRTGEIDILHRTHRISAIFGIMPAPDTMAVHRDNLPRLDIPDELCPDGIECTGLAGKHISVAQSCYRKRPETVFVTAGIYPVPGHDDECESPLDHIESLHYREYPRLAAVHSILLDKMRKNLAVRRRLEKASPVLQIFSQLRGIHDIAVVGQGEIPRIMSEKERLDILDTSASCRGITDMSDGH